MRMCAKCEKGRWNGLKKSGMFVCAECLAKAAEKKDEAPKPEEKK